MTQEIANYYLIGIGILTLLVLCWYTWETRRMQKAVNRQAQELVRQIRLSIMPAFAIEFVAVRDEHQSKIMQASLTNIGNGTAVSIAIEPLAMAHSVNIGGPYAFKEIVKLAIGETKLVEKTEASLPRFTDFEVAAKAFTLSVRFQDIEGNKYKQEIFMDRGICKPRPVAALTPDEADLPIKVVVQEAEPSINTYRQ
jgi:hypothetical protein